MNENTSNYESSQLSFENHKNKRWLTPIEFAEEFSIATSTQAKLRMDGKLPYSKFGKFVHYDRIRINELFEKHKVC